MLSQAEIGMQNCLISRTRCSAPAILLALARRRGNSALLPEPAVLCERTNDPRLCVLTQIDTEPVNTPYLPVRMGAGCWYPVR